MSHETEDDGPEMTAAPSHPEPVPVPAPDSDPPQPIPPPEPVPAPEPPHKSALASYGADFIDAGPDAIEAPYPPPGAFADEPGASEPGAAAAPSEPGASTDAGTELLPAVSDQTEQMPAVRTDDTTQLPAVPGGEAPTVWHQPVPSGPWHARHEKPGEWQYEPPEHLSFEHSPPAEVQIPSLLGAAAVPVPAAQPWEVPLKAEDGDRRRRNGLWISVTLTTTLLLCGGGAASAYLLLRDSDTGGAPDPATAVNEFLTAVYTRQDPGAAGELVCREARDKDKLTAKVEQIKGYAAEYDAPTFRWDEPAVDGRTDERATVSVQLTMATEDEKTAEQTLTFTTVRKSGWLVCEIKG